MAFGFGKKDKNNDPKTENTAENQAVQDAANDKQRLKKIKNMKKKFEETVWNSALETMKTQIPQFVMMEPDPDDADLQITKYVCLGFDTKIVDDFANKSDDDVGSIMTAIKNSMDVVVEYGLFDNELILFIPTSKTLAAIHEFEESFDLKFSIVYCYDDHKMSIETYPDSEEYIYVTLDQIREMLEDGLNIKDLIKSVQANGMVSDDFSDVGMLADTDEDPEKDEEIPDEVDDEVIPDEAEDDEVIPDEPDDEEAESKSTDTVRNAVGTAVTENAVVAQHIDSTKEDIVKTEDASTAVNNIANDQNGAKSETAAPTASSVASAASKLDKLKAAVQSASDDALKDEQIAQSSVNINPQTRVQAFDMSQMDNYVKRRYYSDDLGLEVSSEAFDAMFMQGNIYQPFIEVDGDDWLSGYVNNLRRDCNARLAKLHQENLQIMRERFMLIITKQCEAITKACTIDDPKARFGYALKAITTIKNNNLAALPEQAEAYKREKENEYNERMKAEMQNAANIAKSNFINRYGKEHDRELKEIEQDLRNNIESEFISARENLQKERQAEAKRQLDAVISEALKICADEYTKMLAAERKEYVRLQEVITNFQNDNMAADEARIFTLSEDQRRNNEIVKVREEYDAKFSNVTKDFEAKLAAAKAEIERTTADHNEFIEEMKRQHEKDLQDLRDRHAEQMALKESEIATLNDQLTGANGRIDVLTNEYSKLEGNVEKKYSTQIDMLKSEREAWSEKAAQSEHLNKYFSKIKLVGMIIIAVAALGIGIIIGCAFMAKKNNEANIPIVHYINEETSATTTEETTESTTVETTTGTTEETTEETTATNTDVSEESEN